MATLNNYYVGDIEDAIVTAMATALNAVTHPLGGSNTFVVGSYEDSFEAFVKHQSSSAVCWVHLRNAPDTALENQKFNKDLEFRIKVAVPYSMRQEKTNSQVKAYLYLLRKAVVESIGTNRTWSGYAWDSYVRDEQDFTLNDPPYEGFEITLLAKTYYWYT